MIVNGKLTRIDTVAYGVSGDPTYTPGATLDADCAIDEPTGSLAFLQWAATNGVTARIFVRKDELPAGQVLAQGNRVVANQEDDASITYVVVKANDRVFRSISHFELFCRVA